MKSTTVISILPLIISLAAGLPAQAPPCPGAPIPTPTGIPVLPSGTPAPAPPGDDASNTPLVAAITAAAPTSNDCSKATAPEECVTAQVAAPFIEQSFTTYDITNINEKAALVSLMLLESVNFQFNKNKSPGVPGQGTRNMQSPVFNDEYASEITKDSAEYQDAKAKQPEEAAAEAILALVNDNEHSFASAAWFLVRKCTPEVRTALQSGSPEGFTSYTKDCIGTEATPARAELYEKVKAEMAKAGFTR